MPSGFEDYILSEFTNPTVALSRAQQHLVYLSQLEGQRVAEDGVSIDPSTLAATIERVRKDVDRLAAKVYRIGMPRFQPTRRKDGAPWASPGQGNS